MPRPTRYPETAKRLNELARSHGIQSDSEFARKIGVERGTVGSWLKGRFRPRGQNLSTVAEYFKVSEAYVLALEESSQADTSRVAMALAGVERAQAELTEAIRLLSEAMAESSDSSQDPLSTLSEEAVRVSEGLYNRGRDGNKARQSEKTG